MTWTDYARHLAEHDPTVIGVVLPLDLAGAQISAAGAAVTALTMTDRDALTALGVRGATLGAGSAAQSLLAAELALQHATGTGPWVTEPPDPTSNTDSGPVELHRAAVILIDAADQLLASHPDHNPQTTAVRVELATARLLLTGTPRRRPAPRSDPDRDTDGHVQPR